MFHLGSICPTNIECVVRAFCSSQCFYKTKSIPSLISGHVYVCSILTEWLVTRVVNTYGPQTHSGGGQGAAGEQQRGPVARDCGNPAIEERLNNIETHLKLPEGQRLGWVSLKQIEIQLECLSGKSWWSCQLKSISIQAVQQVLHSSAGPVPLSFYQRLKKLEDRILELEGLSPEYFQSMVSLMALE